MFAYATVITTDSRLADAVVLAYSLHCHGSQFPLVVLCSKAVSSAALAALEEAKDSLNILIERISSNKENSDFEQLGNNSTLQADATES